MRQRLGRHALDLIGDIVVRVKKAELQKEWSLALAEKGDEILADLLNIARAFGLEIPLERGIRKNVDLAKVPGAIASLLEDGWNRGPDAVHFEALSAVRQADLPVLVRVQPREDAAARRTA